MRNLLALLGAAIVAFVVVGWYLDWYKLRSAPADEGHHSVNIDIDKAKIGQDLHRGGERLHDAIEHTKKDIAPSSAKAPETAPKIFEEDF